jgi:hypothetical protein
MGFNSLFKGLIQQLNIYGSRKRILDAVLFATLAGDAEVRFVLHSPWKKSNGRVRMSNICASDLLRLQSGVKVIQ